MKKIVFCLAVLTSIPAMAEEYWDEYEYEYDASPEYVVQRDNYVGVRLHKNENIAFKYDINDGGNTTIRKDNWGFGAVVGNRLTDNIKIEFETMYTGAKQTKRDTNFDFDVWANMLNVHLFQEYADAVAPYVGMGIGFATVWGDVS
ncbi:MAG: hypothetical protein IIV74_03010, partial [Alphaproteobacteria bacterium]|nr:hypothetical protein [Alphaproteobacteria bacterium]